MRTIGDGSEIRVVTQSDDSEQFYLGDESKDVDLSDLTLLEFARADGPTAKLEQAEDLAEAASLATRSFRNFALSDEGAEIIGYVLDGALRDERSPDVQQSLDRLVREIADPDSIDPADNTAFRSPDFRLMPVEIGIAAAETAQDSAIVRAATAFPDDGPAVVLISSGLGLKDTLLMSQEAFADSIVGHAEAVGIPLSEGDLAARLTESLRIGTAVASKQSLAAPGTGEILLDGKITPAVFR